MVDQYRYPYLDSSAYIAWIKHEIVDSVDRHTIISHILRCAEDGEFRIGNSTLTIAEVHRLRGATPLNAAQDEAILAFFEHDYLDFVDVDRNIAEHANRLCRELNVYPNDAIHIASAIRLGCDVLLAWDRRLTSVIHPGIRIEAPRILGQGRLQGT
ncbi:MAG: type II toxin-antitoxin system VapC family toxin [Dehalococcoidia bacterium]